MGRVVTFDGDQFGIKYFKWNDYEIAFTKHN